MTSRPIALSLALVLAAPLAAEAQQPDQVRRIGVLMGFARSDSEAQAYVAAFREGLQKLGWTEGRNIRIDYRWAALDAEAMQRFAKELVALQPNLILSHNTPAFLNPFKAAGASFGVKAITASVRDMSELESVVAAQAREPNAGLVVMPDGFLIAHRAEVASLAARHRHPAVYPFRFFAELGGLMSYGVDLTDNFRRAATYADRILKGTKPSELPVQAPVKFELVINLKTAKALGLTVPPSLLGRADELIQ